MHATKKRESQIGCTSRPPENELTNVNYPFGRLQINVFSNFSTICKVSFRPSVDKFFFRTSVVAVAVVADELS